MAPGAIVNELSEIAPLIIRKVAIHDNQSIAKMVK